MRWEEAPYLRQSSLLAYAVRNLVPHTILLQPPSEAVAAARRSATAKVQVWVPSGAARRRLGDGWCSVAMAMPSAIGARREAAGEAEGASCRHGSRKAEVVRWRVGVGRCDEAVATPPVASGRREGCWLLAIGMRGVCSEGFGTD